MIADRTLVVLLVGVTLALLIIATVSGNGIAGWAAIAGFAAAIAAYVRWRVRRRRTNVLD